VQTLEQWWPLSVSTSITISGLTYAYLDGAADAISYSDRCRRPDFWSDGNDFSRKIMARNRSRSYEVWSGHLRVDRVDSYSGIFDNDHVIFECGDRS
jgi:hypothetical protein